MFLFLIIFIASTFSTQCISNSEDIFQSSSHISLEENNLEKDKNCTSYIYLSNKTFHIIYTSPELAEGSQSDDSSLGSRLRESTNFIINDKDTEVCSFNLPSIFNLPTHVTCYINKTYNSIIIANEINISERYGKSDDELIDAYQNSFFSIIDFFLDELASKIFSKDKIDKKLFKEFFIDKYTHCLNVLIKENIKTNLTQSSYLAAIPILEKLFLLIQRSQDDLSILSKVLTYISASKCGISLINNGYEYAKCLFFKSA